MRPVTVTYSLTADQFMVACNALWSHQAIGKNGNWIISVTLALGTAISVLYAPSATFLLASAALFFAAASPVRNWLWRRHYGTLVKYTGPIGATFGSDAIDVHSADGAYTQPWQFFNGYTDTAGHIFLHVGQRGSRGQFSIIPKSALSKPADLAALMGLLSDKLPKRANRWL